MKTWKQKYLELQKKQNNRGHVCNLIKHMCSSCDGLENPTSGKNLLIHRDYSYNQAIDDVLKTLEIPNLPPSVSVCDLKQRLLMFKKK